MSNLTHSIYVRTFGVAQCDAQVAPRGESAGYSFTMEPGGSGVKFTPPIQEVMSSNPAGERISQCIGCFLSDQLQYWLDKASTLNAEQLFILFKASHSVAYAFFSVAFEPET